MENYITVVNKGRRVVPFGLNPAQENYRRNQSLRDYILKPRQVGFTTFCLAEGLVESILDENYTFLFMSHDETTTKAMMNRVHGMYDRIPVIKPQLTKRTEHELHLENNSQIIIATASGRNPVRSRTVNRAHLSEYAFWNDPGRVFVGINEAVPAEGVMVIETTPLGLNSEAHKLWKESVAGKSVFKPHFYCWWDVTEYQITKDSNPSMLPYLILNGELDTEEEKLEAEGASLGALSWRRWKRAQPYMDTKFSQEYPTNDFDCWLTNELAFFDLESLRALMTEVKEPIESYTDGPFDVKLWRKPDAASVYVAGTDVAEGLSNHDRSVTDVIDNKTGVHVATLKGHGDADLLADASMKLLKRFYFPLWGIEKNAYGLACVKRAEALGYPKLFRRGPRSHKGMREPDPNPGWLTSSGTRLPMLNELQAVVRDREFLTFDRESVDEMQSFIWHNGKVQAINGAHDDCVMSLAIANQMRQYARRTNTDRKVIVRSYA